MTRTNILVPIKMASRCGIQRGLDVKLDCQVSASSTSSRHFPSQKNGPSSQPWRSEPASWLRRRPFQVSQLLLFVLLACCLSMTSASAPPYNEIDARMADVTKANVDVGVVSDLLRSSLDRLARTGTLLVDHSPEPQHRDNNNDNDANNNHHTALSTTNDELKRRQVGGNEDEYKTTSASAPKNTSSATKSSSSKTSSAAIPAATQQTTTQLPSPFDQGFSGNITESCSNFVNGFLRNSTFKACLPFSLLLQNSNSFFEATKSILYITQILDTTCSADLAVCNPLMESLAANISASANCASDLANQNPLIRQASLGLKAYKTLYSASCLRNPQTSSYCFADAITNTTSPTDSYIYYLPLNISLPGGSQPSCNACLKSSMAIFSAASSDRTSAISKTYLNAAQQINLQCGPGFVNPSLAVEIKSSAVALVPGFAYWNTGMIALTVLLGSWLL